MCRTPLLREMATRNFTKILELLQGGTRLEPTPAVETAVLRRGLERLAPFHRGKNSVADALLIELYGLTVQSDLAGIEEYALVTSNSKDFSVADGDDRVPHPDFADFFASPRSHYFTSIRAAVDAHFHDREPDLLLDVNYREEPRRIAEIEPVIDKLWNQIWYTRHKHLEHRIVSGEMTLVDEYDPSTRGKTIVRRVWERARAAAREVEEEYGLDELGPWSEYEWGELSGKMSALRWALGEEWESTLDT